MESSRDGFLRKWYLSWESRVAELESVASMPNHGDGHLGAPVLKGAMSLRGLVQCGQFVPHEKCCVPTWPVWMLMAQEKKS